MKKTEKRRRIMMQKAREKRHKKIEEAIQELAQKLNLADWTITVTYYYRADILGNRLAFTNINDNYKQIQIGILSTEELDSYDIRRIIAHELAHVVIGLPGRTALNLLKGRYTEQEQELILSAEETAVEHFVQIVAPCLGLPRNVQLPTRDTHPLETKKGGEKSEEKS